MGGPPILSINSSNETKDELSTVFNEILQEIKQESPQETNVSLDKIMFSVSEELPYPSHTTINFPSKETATYQVTKLNRENWLKAIFPDVLTYNSTGKLIKTDLFKNKPLHKKFIAISLPLHTGEILGLSGVIFYFIICLICCSLPITGIIIWLKKN